MLGPLELGIILAIVLLLFGTKRLRSLGSDLGGAIRGFKKSIKDTDAEATGHKATAQSEQLKDSQDIDAQVREVEENQNTKS